MASIAHYPIDQSPLNITIYCTMVAGEGASNNIPGPKLSQLISSVK